MTRGYMKTVETEWTLKTGQTDGTGGNQGTGRGGETEGLDGFGPTVKSEGVGCGQGPEKIVSSGRSEGTASIQGDRRTGEIGQPGWTKPSLGTSQGSVLGLRQNQLKVPGVLVLTGDQQSQWLNLLGEKNKEFKRTVQIW